jgi:hypothetical protein
MLERGRSIYNPKYSGSYGYKEGDDQRVIWASGVSKFGLLQCLPLD